VRILLRFVASAACAVAAGQALAETHGLDVQVEAVADGDSLMVRDSNGVEHEVRLAAIDAPEHGQPYSRQSRDALSAIVLGRPVRIEWAERDGYGRLVARVWVIPGDAPCQSPGCPKTLDAGLAQLSSGLAWHYKKYQDEQSLEDRHRYADAEVEARARRIGRWAEPGSVRAPAIVGGDVVELNPKLDPTGITGVVAAKLARELLARMIADAGGSPAAVTRREASAAGRRSRGRPRASDSS
jgi:endonuclease YncB( thermonuclease family)